MIDNPGTPPTDVFGIIAAAELVLVRADLQVRLESFARHHVVALDTRDRLDELLARPLPDASSPQHSLAKTARRDLLAIAPKLDDALQEIVACRQTIERNLAALDRQAEHGPAPELTTTDTDGATEHPA